MVPCAVTPLLLGEGVFNSAAKATARVLLLARHGSVGAIYLQRYVGRTDPPLDTAGRCQARALAELVQLARPQRCFSSPLRRAVETAGIVAATVGVEVEVDRDLREIDFGLCEGMTFGEMQRRFPQAAGCWGAMPEDFAFPEGERLGDFVDRVRRAADRLVTEPSDVVLAISHGGVIRTMICHLLGLPVRDCWLFEVRPASLTTIEMMDGKAVLAGLSNSCTAQE